MTIHYTNERSMHVKPGSLELVYLCLQPVADGGFQETCLKTVSLGLHDIGKN